MSESDFAKAPNGLANSSLPVEIIAIISKQLVADEARGTCAALNVTCQNVHQETLPVLWRVVVQWGANTFKKMPIRFDDGVISAKEAALRNKAEKEVSEAWTRFLDSRGTKYIEYLVIPGFSLQTPEMRLLANRLNPEGTSSLFPKLKAVISAINLSIGTPQAHANCGGIIHITSGYRVGSEDIFQLAMTVKMFYEVSDSNMKQILDKSLLFPLMHNIVRDDTLPIHDRWNYTEQMATEWRTILKTYRAPKILMLPVIENANADTTNVTIINAFLDLAYWTSRGNGSAIFEIRGAVTASNLLPEQINLLARAAQAATFQNPSMATANWEITTAHLPFTPAALAEMHRVLAISRETYLRATRGVNKSKFGETSIRWFTDDNLTHEFRVIPFGWESRMTTLVKFAGEPGKIVKMESW